VVIGDADHPDRHAACTNVVPDVVGEDALDELTG